MVYILVFRSPKWFFPFLPASLSETFISISTSFFISRSNFHNFSLSVSIFPPSTLSSSSAKVPVFLKKNIIFPITIWYLSYYKAWWYRVLESLICRQFRAGGQTGQLFALISRIGEAHYSWHTSFDPTRAMLMDGWMDGWMERRNWLIPVDKSHNYVYLKITLARGAGHNDQISPSSATSCNRLLALLLLFLLLVRCQCLSCDTTTHITGRLFRWPSSVTFFHDHGWKCCWRCNICMFALSTR